MHDDDGEGAADEIEPGKQRQHEQDHLRRAISAHGAQFRGDQQAEAAETEIHREIRHVEVRLDEQEPAQRRQAAARQKADPDIGHAPPVTRHDRPGQAAGGNGEAYVGQELGRRHAERQREILQQETRRTEGIAESQHGQIGTVALMEPQHEERSAERQRYRRIEQRYE